MIPRDTIKWIFSLLEYSFILIFGLFIRVCTENLGILEEYFSAMYRKMLPDFDLSQTCGMMKELSLFISFL